MPCYKPLSLPRPKLKTGFQTVPCGRCIGCRLERSRQWAMRVMCEAQLHKHNSFITLTYREADLPWGRLAPTLVPRDLTLFWKRLRKEFGYGIRYYACGEYGERFGRPHYHSAVFGFDFPDKRHTDTKNDFRYYSSAELDRIWGHGNCIIGDLTFESAAYVARYVTSKLTGPSAVKYVQRGQEPEFSRMSLKPGIGAAWFDKYSTDVFPRGHMRIRGKVSRPPRYFLELLKRFNPLEADIQAGRRIFEGNRKYWIEQDTGAPNLALKKAVKLAQIKQLIRTEF